MNLTIKTERIQFGETKIFGIFKKAVKFNVVADIPDSILHDYAEIAKIKPDENNPDEQKKAFSVMKKVIITMFCISNKRRKVEKFVRFMFC